MGIFALLFFFSNLYNKAVLYIALCVCLYDTFGTFPKFIWFKLYGENIEIMFTLNHNVFTENFSLSMSLFIKNLNCKCVLRQMEILPITVSLKYHAENITSLQANNE